MSTSQRSRKQLTPLQRRKKNQKRNKKRRKQLTPLQRQKKNLKRNQKHMTDLFHKLNCNDLVVTFIPSHRPGGDGLSLDVLYGPDKFNIHSLMPSFHEPSPKGIKSEGIKTSNGFDMPNLTLPKVKPELLEDLKKHWHSVKKGKSLEDHLKHQANKHLKYHQLLKQDIYAVTLLYGKDLVSEEGRHYLMRIIQDKGYYAGQIYSCATFTKDLEEDLGSLKVTFRKHPDGAHWGVLYLHELHMLYDHASNRILGARKQSFTSEDVFLLEDLRTRRKSSLFCTAANP